MSELHDKTKRQRDRFELKDGSPLLRGLVFACYRGRGGEGFMTVPEEGLDFVWDDELAQWVPDRDDAELVIV